MLTDPGKTLLAGIQNLRLGDIPRNIAKAMLQEEERKKKEKEDAFLEKLRNAQLESSMLSSELSKFRLGQEKKEAERKQTGLSELSSVMDILQDPLTSQEMKGTGEIMGPPRPEAIGAKSELDIIGKSKLPMYRDLPEVKGFVNPYEESQKLKTTREQDLSDTESQREFQREQATTAFDRQKELQQMQFAQQEKQLRLKNEMSEKGPVKLTARAQNRLQEFLAGFDVLKEYDKALAKGDYLGLGKKLSAAVGELPVVGGLISEIFTPDMSGLRNMKKQVAELFLRAATGAQANESEVRLYMDFLPNAGEPIEIARRKMENFITVVRSRAMSTTALLRATGDTKGADFIEKNLNEMFKYNTQIESKIDKQTAERAIDILRTTGKDIEADIMERQLKEKLASEKVEQTSIPNSDIPRTKEEAMSYGWNVYASEKEAEDKQAKGKIWIDGIGPVEVE